MIIKYSNPCGEKAIVYIPDNVHWEIIRCPDLDSTEHSYQLHLIIDEKEHLLDDMESWDTHSNVPPQEIFDLFGDIVDNVAEQLLGNSNLQLLDIDKIIEEIISKKYTQKWTDNGYHW